MAKRVLRFGEMWVRHDEDWSSYIAPDGTAYLSSYEEFQRLGWDVMMRENIGEWLPWAVLLVRTEVRSGMSLGQWVSEALKERRSASAVELRTVGGIVSGYVEWGDGIGSACSWHTMPRQDLGFEVRAIAAMTETGQLAANVHEIGNAVINAVEFHC